jgi:DNA-binding CsgD family transcriptional regulator/tetratricopeptide (TPR) repeat protein
MLQRKCGESGRGGRALMELGRRRRRDGIARLVVWPAETPGTSLAPSEPFESLAARAPARQPDRPPEAHVAGPARSFEGIGWLWHVLGQSTVAREQWTELLRLAATSAETPVRAETLNLVGRFASTTGDAATANTFFQEALIAGRAGRSSASVVRSLCGLAEIAIGRGAFDLARTLQEEALELQRRLGQADAAARSLAILGWLTLETRGARHAEALHEESLTLRVTREEPLVIALSLVHLGWLAHLTGRQETARRHLSEALMTVRGCPDRWKIVALLAVLGRPSPVAPPMRRAIGLLAAAEVHEAAAQVQAEALADMGGCLAEAGDRLTPRALAVAWGGGQQMDVAGLVEQALQVAEAQAGHHRASAAVPAEPMPLTAREVEVATLIGRGHTNRRIADTLVIAERTAETHARNIREKLGLSTRAQIAAWAAARGLLGTDA